MKQEPAWGVGLLALLTIVLAIVITTSQPVPILRSTASPAATPTVTSEKPTPAPTGHRRSKPKPAAAPTPIPLTVWIVLAIPLVLAAVVLLWLLLGGRERRRRRPLPPPAFTPDDLDALDVDREQRLADAVQTQLADLTTGAPRNAVVACWLALEDAASQIGFYRKPSLTSAEFTEAVLAAYDLDGGAIRRLSSLYREARFSDHEITEQHRQAAAAALNTLRAELSARSRLRLPAAPTP